MGKLDNMQSYAASTVRGLRGFFATGQRSIEPAEPLELYEFESCPFCRKVRDVLSELDLVYVSHPCPKGSKRRAYVIERGGQEQFPFLVDPNTGAGMYESEDIIDYLHRAYGRGRHPAGRALAPLDLVGSALSSLVRPRGGRVRPGCEDREPLPERLILYNFEISPYCRKVREVLCELNIVYEVRNVAKRSKRRPELVARGGKMQVPYLIDPNTGAELYESDVITSYLEAHYAPR